MKKTLSLSIALAVAAIGYTTATAPSLAATRLMVSSLEGFQYRCEHHGGAYAKAGSVVSCNTPSVAVSCEYFHPRQAYCNWPGIERQIDVVRVIGTLPPAGSIVASSSDNGPGGNGNGGNGGGGNGGGGLQGPKDIKDAPQEDPKPNFDGPKDFQDAPKEDPKPNFDGPKDFQLAP
ncbi:MAG TPA: hypothetical protein VIL88_17015 [Devosia sp.]|jgi:uncharacterized membrane protein YgcG|uniref:hypothetical protein n=1 Tax=Devosia sp. TaxID=1871048 RepID=UPI002F94E43C